MVRIQGNEAGVDRAKMTWGSQENES